jgi:hypothetical protein
MRRPIDRVAPSPPGPTKSTNDGDRGGHTMGDSKAIEGDRGRQGRGGRGEMSGGRSSAYN